MPWDIYLDWLQDQGNEDLRDVDVGLILSGFHATAFINYGFIDAFGSGVGSFSNLSGDGFSSEGCGRGWIPHFDVMAGNGIF